MFCNLGGALASPLEMIRSIAGRCRGSRFLAGTLILLSFFASSYSTDRKTAEVTVFFTGLVRGNYGPCGCNTEPSGGFARRSAYARQYASDGNSAIIHVDAGGILMPRGPRAAHVNPEMLNAVRDLPVSVVNLSPPDLFLWDDVAASDLVDRFISTNLSPLDPQRPSPVRYRIIEVLAGEEVVRIGFLGISDPRKVKPNSGFRGEDPARAVHQIKAAVLKEADFLVVLADIPQRPEESILDQLARDHPEIIAVLTTEDAFRLHEPRVVNNAVILSSVERGRYLGQLKLAIDENGRVVEFEPDFIEMGEEQPEDQRFLEIQKSLAPYLD